MNCQQGDLAFIVKARDIRNIGKIVKILRPAVVNEEFISNSRVLTQWTGDCYSSWVVHSDSPLSWRLDDGSTCMFNDRVFWDACLRPLRDNPGQDETLTWAPVPKKVEA